MISRIRPSDSSAFTMLEVLVVLTIASLLASGVAFRISNGFDRIALAHAESWLDSTLIELRGSARREGRAQAVEFDLVAGRYRVSDKAWRDLPPNVAWSFEEGKDHRISAHAITFLPDGSASGATIVALVGTLVSARRVDSLPGSIHHVGR